ncbi:LysR family transcriptional regulator [Pseudoclavibacter endophyticus]|uniref:LysR family transcriptional regulator n=1 Tax=Pseudoclavibacter endophyticus TaxID=1778590 RepID=A0A6H9WJJ6_9MICO|nr:LysR family transcriptional regulator [Pseudoclavibacter endophyticus]KAB1648996.1 LysR family transcriptional regulator [Pseudoclavibacter endophyticus]GGA66407.1 LysR family transcriptional regulator [Pseudoclavibacter endophyticus]
MGNAPFTLRQLEYFEAVASEGSLTAASVRCRVTPSALTLAIDDLERHLRVQLLVRRKGRGVTLTRAGSRLLQRARDVLGSVDALATEASREISSVSGRFVVGCFTTLTPFVVPAIVGRFQRIHPEVEVEIAAATADVLYDQLMQARVDVAFLYSVDVPSSLAFDPVLQLRPHVIVSSTHPLADRQSVSLHELQDDPLILLDVPPTRQNTRGLFDRLGFEPRVAHTSSNFETVRCLVAYGLGYAVEFQRPATAQTYAGAEVRTLGISDDLPVTVLGLARPHGAAETARYDALKAFIRRGEIGGEPIVA